MTCPKCEAGSRVVDTREVEGQRQRKRKCRMGHIFYTKEVAMRKWSYVDPRIKNPGTGYSKKAKKLRKTPVGGLVLQKETPNWVKTIYLKINE
jgi:transcriptional regulator NrdR family protein